MRGPRHNLDCCATEKKMTCRIAANKSYIARGNMRAVANIGKLETS
jgi:hypothetical protein